MSLADEIKKRRIEAIQLEGVGEVRLVRLRAADVLALSSDEKKEDRDFGFKLIEKSVVDETGQLLFASVEEVKELDWVIVQELIGQVNRLNGLETKEAEKK